MREVSEKKFFLSRVVNHIIGGSPSAASFAVIRPHFTKHAILRSQHFSAELLTVTKLKIQFN